MLSCIFCFSFVKIFVMENNYSSENFGAAKRIIHKEVNSEMLCHDCSPQPPWLSFYLMESGRTEYLRLDSAKQVLIFRAHERLD